MLVLNVLTAVIFLSLGFLIWCFFGFSRAKRAGQTAPVFAPPSAGMPADALSSIVRKKHPQPKDEASTGSVSLINRTGNPTRRTRSALREWFLARASRMALNVRRTRTKTATLTSRDASVANLRLHIARNRAASTGYRNLR